MKLHVIQARSEDRKRASDLLDLYRLLEAHNRDGEIATAFAASPGGLEPLMLEALAHVFRRDVTRALHWIRGFGDPAWIDVLTEEAMSDIATDFLDTFGQA